MYTLKFGIQITSLRPKEISDRMFLSLHPLDQIKYEKKVECQPEQSFNSYPQAPNPDGGAWPDFSLPSSNDESINDSNSSYDSGATDAGTSFDFGGGDGGGGGASGDW